MSQEFVIKSTVLEDKINQLLPSQGGAQAGVDLSASSMIVPIIDLTESAEGSTLRQDLQTAVDSATTKTLINNATNTVLLTTTGFFRVRIVNSNRSGTSQASLNLFDGVTSTDIWQTNPDSSCLDIVQQDLVVYLRAGDSLRGTAQANSYLNVFTRQIADVSGNLTNPLGFV